MYTNFEIMNSKKIKNCIGGGIVRGGGDGGLSPGSTRVRTTHY